MKTPTIQQLEKSLRAAWTPGTAYPGDATRWTPNQPEVGQCAVTALVVNDFFGGEIVGDTALHHYWNRLPDGREVDVTKGQFTAEQQAALKADKIVSRKELLDGERASKAKTPERYQTLAARVYKMLS